MLDVRESKLLLVASAVQVGLVSSMARLISCMRFVSSLVFLAVLAVVLLSPCVNAEILPQNLYFANGTTVTTYIDTTTQEILNVTVTNVDGSYLFTADNGKHIEYKFANGTDVVITDNGTITTSTLDWNNGTTATFYTSKGKMEYGVIDFGNGTIITGYANGTEVVSQENSGSKSSARTFIPSGIMALAVYVFTISVLFT